MDSLREKTSRRPGRWGTLYTQPSNQIGRLLSNTVMKTASNVCECKQGGQQSTLSRKASSNPLTDETVMSVNGVDRNVNKRVWYREVEPSFRYGRYINVKGMQNSAQFLMNCPD